MITEFTKSRIMKCYDIMWEYVEKLNSDESLDMDDEEVQACVHNLKTAIIRQKIALPKEVFEEIFAAVCMMEELAECSKEELLKDTACCDFDDCVAEDVDEDLQIHYLRLCKLAHFVAEFGEEILRPYLITQ